MGSSTIANSKKVKSKIIQIWIVGLKKLNSAKIDRFGQIWRISPNCYQILDFVGKSPILWRESANWNHPWKKKLKLECGSSPIVSTSWHGRLQVNYWGNSNRFGLFVRSPLFSSFCKKFLHTRITPTWSTVNRLFETGRYSRIQNVNGAGILWQVFAGFGPNARHSSHKFQN